LPKEVELNGRLSTVDLLIKLGCFVKKEHKVLELKGADLNKEVKCTEPSTSIRLPWLAPSNHFHPSLTFASDTEVPH
jgi:hypothetical protein